MEPERVLGIFKFGQKRHIDDFVTGRLYMNTLAYFVQSEKHFVHHDEREGQAVWWQNTTLSMEIDGEYKPIACGHIAITDPETLKANVFCMHALRASVAKNLVDLRNFAFGDTFAVLKDGDEFLRRVSEAAKRTGHKLRWKLVEYVDKDVYHGEVGIFRKSSEFAHQSEFRIALLPGTGAPYVLDVGNLTDLVMTGPLADLNRRMKVE